MAKVMEEQSGFRIPTILSTNKIPKFGYLLKLEAN